MNELQTIKRKILLKEQALFLISRDEKENREKICTAIENLWQLYREVYKEHCLSQIRTVSGMNQGSISSHHVRLLENHEA